MPKQYNVPGFTPPPNDPKRVEEQKGLYPEGEETKGIQKQLKSMLQTASELAQQLEAAEKKFEPSDELKHIDQTINGLLKRKQEIQNEEYSQIMGQDYPTARQALQTELNTLVDLMREHKVNAVQVKDKLVRLSQMKIRSNQLSAGLVEKAAKDLQLQKEQIEYLLKEGKKLVDQDIAEIILSTEGSIRLAGVWVWLKGVLDKVVNKVRDFVNDVKTETATWDKIDDTLNQIEANAATASKRRAVKKVKAKMFRVFYIESGPNATQRGSAGAEDIEANTAEEALKVVTDKGFKADLENVEQLSNDTTQTTSTPEEVQQWFEANKEKLKQSGHAFDNLLDLLNWVNAYNYATEWGELDHDDKISFVEEYYETGENESIEDDEFPEVEPAEDIVEQLDDFIPHDLTEEFLRRVSFNTVEEAINELEGLHGEDVVDLLKQFTGIDAGKKAMKQIKISSQLFDIIKKYVLSKYPAYQDALSETQNLSQMEDALKEKGMKEADIIKCVQEALNKINISLSTRLTVKKMADWESDNDLRQLMNDSNNLRNRIVNIVKEKEKQEGTTLSQWLAHDMQSTFEDIEDALGGGEDSEARQIILDLGNTKSSRTAGGKLTIWEYDDANDYQGEGGGEVDLLSEEDLMHPDELGISPKAQDAVQEYQEPPEDKMPGNAANNIAGASKKADKIPVEEVEWAEVKKQKPATEEENGLPDKPKQAKRLRRKASGLDKIKDALLNNYINLVQQRGKDPQAFAAEVNAATTFQGIRNVAENWQLGDQLDEVMDQALAGSKRQAYQGDTGYDDLMDAEQIENWNDLLDYVDQEEAMGKSNSEIQDAIDNYAPEHSESLADYFKNRRRRRKAVKPAPKPGDQVEIQPGMQGNVTNVDTADPNNTKYEVQGTDGMTYEMTDQDFMDPNNPAQAGKKAQAPGRKVDEDKWSDAKAQAKKQGKGGNWAYITSIYKNMGGKFGNKDIEVKAAYLESSKVTATDLNALFETPLTLGEGQEELVQALTIKFGESAAAIVDAIQAGDILEAYHMYREMEGATPESFEEIDWGQDVGAEVVDDFDFGDIVMVEGRKGTVVASSLFDVTIKFSNNRTQSFPSELVVAYLDEEQEKQLQMNQRVTVDPAITTDPYDKKGQSGTIIDLDNDVATIKFDDGSVGQYKTNTLEASKKLASPEDLSREFHQIDSKIAGNEDWEQLKDGVMAQTGSETFEDVITKEPGMAAKVITQGRSYTASKKAALSVEQIKGDLNGYEISSQQFEGVVSVQDDYVILPDGKKIKPNDTQWKTLWDELIYQEFGTNNIDIILRNEGFASKKGINHKPSRRNPYEVNPETKDTVKPYSQNNSEWDPQYEEEQEKQKENKKTAGGTTNNKVQFNGTEFNKMPGESDRDAIKRLRKSMDDPDAKWSRPGDEWDPYKTEQEDYINRASVTAGERPKETNPYGLAQREEDFKRVEETKGNPEFGNEKIKPKDQPGVPDGAVKKLSRKKKQATAPAPEEWVGKKLEVIEQGNFNVIKGDAYSIELYPGQVLEVIGTQKGGWLQTKLINGGQLEKQPGLSGRETAPEDRFHRSSDIVIGVSLNFNKGQFKVIAETPEDWLKGSSKEKAPKTISIDAASLIQLCHLSGKQSKKIFDGKREVKASVVAKGKAIQYNNLIVRGEFMDDIFIPHDDDYTIIDVPAITADRLLEARSKIIANYDDVITTSTDLVKALKDKTLRGAFISNIRFQSINAEDVDEYGNMTQGSIKYALTASDAVQNTDKTLYVTLSVKGDNINAPEIFTDNLGVVYPLTAEAVTSLLQK